MLSVRFIFRYILAVCSMGFPMQERHSVRLLDRFTTVVYSLANSLYLPFVKSKSAHCRKANNEAKKIERMLVIKKSFILFSVAYGLVG